MLHMSGRAMDQRVAGPLVDELLDALVVPLTKCRARTLPVVGKHNEAIASRRVRGGLLEEPDDAVQSAERIESLDAFGTGMVGDLVVVHEIDIDERGRAIHLLDDQGRADVTQEHVRCRARQRIGKAAIPARLEVQQSFATGLQQLLQDLAGGEQDPAQDAVRTQEEPVEDMAAPYLFGWVVERGRGEKATRRVAREQIPDRGAAGREQAAAI